MSRAVDFEYAHDLGCTIRQVSTAKLIDGQVYAVVGPSLVARDSPLAGISGSQNLVVSTRRVRRRHACFRATGREEIRPRSPWSLTFCRRRSTDRTESNEPHRPAAATCEVTSDLELPQYVRFVVRDRPGIHCSAGRSVFAPSHQRGCGAAEAGPSEVGSAVRDDVGAVQGEPAASGACRDRPTLISWSSRH